MRFSDTFAIQQTGYELRDTRFTFETRYDQIVMVKQVSSQLMKTASGVIQLNDRLEFHYSHQ
jgi:hypothetical protein